jgi:transcriptional regulator
MYAPSSFREEDRKVLLDFMRRHSFAAVVSRGGDGGGLTASHLPLLVEENGPGELVLAGHMARANLQWRDLESGVEVLALFQGPHGYISPSWYASAQAVPTWNYMVVHVYGAPRIVESDERLAQIVDATVAENEKGFGKPWNGDALPIDFREKLLQAIVGFEIQVSRIEGKFKLGQNRPDEDVEGACRALEMTGREADGELARLMREASEL